MVEIIPKPVEKKFNWQDIIFDFLLFLILASLLAYFILSNSLKKAETNLRNLEEALAKEKTAEEIALEKEVFDYQRKIEDFSKLINLHLFPSKFFEFIEKNSHPKIWFSKLNLNPPKKEAELAGQTENFIILGQQLQIFRSHPLARNLDLVKINLGKEGKIDFELKITFDSQLFKK